jgi:hypothetical protein
VTNKRPEPINQYSNLTRLSGLTRFRLVEYSCPFGFCENKEKLGLNGDLNLGPLSPLSDKFQTIKLGLVLCFHIKVLFPLLFTVFCINIIVSSIHELRNIIYIV